MKVYCIILFNFFFNINPTIAYSDNSSDTVDFYGYKLLFNFNKNEIYLNDNLSEITLNAIFSSILKSNYKSLINQFKEIKKQYGLDDFGYYLLIHKYSCTAFKSNNESYRLFFVWFILYKSGYDTFVEFNELEIRIYAPINISPFIGYGNYQPIDDKNYVDLTFKTEALKNSTEYIPPDNNSNTNILKLNINEYPKLEALVESKKLYFDNNEENEINFSINKSLTQYYGDLPIMSTNKIHKNYGLSKRTGKLIEYLDSIVKSKNIVDGMNIILTFCQKSIEYKEDKEFFGMERPLFVEETLMYGVGDCEDKSLLFAYLISAIFKYETVIFLYENHANVGVNIKGINGKYIEYKGSNYLICEPSYHNAKIGETNVTELPIRVVN